MTFNANSLSIGYDINAPGAITPLGADKFFTEGLLGATRYFALHTDDPGTSGYHELSGNAYARVEVPSSYWTIDAETGLGELTTQVIFPTPTGVWADADWLSIMDAQTGGNVLWKDRFNNNPEAAMTGAAVRLDPHSVTVGLPTDD